MFPRWHHATDVREVSRDDVSAEHDRSWFVDPLAHLKENFNYIRVISEALFKENSKIILNAAPCNTRVFILGANEHLWDPQTSIRRQRMVEPMDSGGDSVAQEGDHSQHPRLRWVRYGGP
jgi:hypothetical protein